MSEAYDVVIIGGGPGGYNCAIRCVKHYNGKGKIVGKGEVEIALNDGKTEKVGAKNIVIATGSEPTVLPGIEIDEERIVTNTGALSLKEVPKKLVLIGAGVIGLEMGSVWSRLGSEVTVIEFLDHIMPGADSEISKQAKKIFEAQGLKFQMSTKVTGIEKLKTKLKVNVEPAKGGDADVIDADVVICAIGRKPYTEGLGLETVGVGVNQRGVIDTSGHFKTNVEGIWAIGDCVAGPMLAHKAEDDGAAVAELIAGKAGHVDYDLVPSVVYTKPEIAWVGKTEQQLKDAGIKYKTGKFPFMANSRARTNHETELIGEICVAMEFKASSEDIARTCHAHPTLSEAIRQAAMGVEGWTMQM